MTAKEKQMISDGFVRSNAHLIYKRSRRGKVLYRLDVMLGKKVPVFTELGLAFLAFMREEVKMQVFMGHDDFLCVLESAWRRAKWQCGVKDDTDVLRDKIEEAIAANEGR